MRIRGLIWKGLLASLMGGACIVPAPSGEASHAPPAGPLTLASGANFGGKVELTRVVFRPGRLRPGDGVRVSLVFRVIEAIDDDYMIFVHLEDAAGRTERRNADHAPLAGSRLTNSWRPGELLTDEFNIDLPAGSTGALNVWLGFWQPTRDLRLKVLNPQAVHTDGNDRVLVGQLSVGP